MLLYLIESRDPSIIFQFQRTFAQSVDDTLRGQNLYRRRPSTHILFEAIRLSESNRSLIAGESIPLV